MGSLSKSTPELPRSRLIQILISFAEEVLISHGGPQTTAQTAPSISRHKTGRSLATHSTSSTLAIFAGVSQAGRSSSRRSKSNGHVNPCSSQQKLTKRSRHLRPKTGQFELFEIDLAPRCEDGTLPNNSILHYWWDVMQKATANKPIACPDAGQMLRQAGFVDVKETTFPLPFSSSWVRGTRERATGQWYKNLIHQEVKNFDPVSMINGLTMGPLTRNLGWSKAQVDDLVARVLDCVENENIHTFHVL